MATGRIDALFFVLGGLIGAGAYILIYGGLAGSALLEPVAGGKATLAPVGGTDYPSLFGGLSGEWLGLAIGVAFIIQI